MYTPRLNSPTYFFIQKGDWAAHKVISIPSKKVEGWALPEMPGKYSIYIFRIINTYMLFVYHSLELEKVLSIVAIAIWYVM